MARRWWPAVDLAPPPSEIVAWNPAEQKAEWPTEYLVFHVSGDLDAPADAPDWWSTWIDIQRLPSALLVADAFQRDRADRLVAAVSPLART